MGQHDPAWRAILLRDYRAPDPTRPAHSARPQAVAARVGFVLLARVQNLRAAPAVDALLAATLQTVRRTPGERAGADNRIPLAMSARVKENQTRMAGSQLSPGHRRARHRAIAAAHPAGTTPSHHRIGLSGARWRPVRGFRPRGGVYYPAAHTRLLWPLSAPSPPPGSFPQKGCEFVSFPSGKREWLSGPYYRVNASG